MNRNRIIAKKYEKTEKRKTAFVKTGKFKWKNKDKNNNKDEQMITNNKEE